MTSFQILILSLALAATPLAAGAALNPGDILVSEFNSDLLVAVDPVTGAQTALTLRHHLRSRRDRIRGRVRDAGDILRARSSLVLTSPTAWNEVWDLARDASGNILAAVRGAPADSVVRVDPITWTQTVVSSGGLFNGLHSITFDQAGYILVANQFSGEIVRVDPVTGAQSIAASGGLLNNSYGVAVEANGDLLVAELTADIVRIASGSGTQTVVSSGGLLTSVLEITLDTDGDIIAINSDSVVRVDPVSGAQTLISNGGNFSSGLVDVIVFSPASPVPALSGWGLLIAAIVLVAVTPLSGCATRQLATYRTSSRTSRRPVRGGQ